MNRRGLWLLPILSLLLTYPAFAAPKRGIAVVRSAMVSLKQRTKVSSSINSHIAKVEKKIAATQTLLDSHTLHVAGHSVNAAFGLTSKQILLTRLRGKISGRVLFKKMPRTTAKKVESLTVLANLLGIDTPIATPVELGPEGEHGVVVPWIGGQTPAQNYDFTQADANVLQNLVMSRWFSELVGDQDVWWGQFLRPKKQSQRFAFMHHIDPDAAWIRRTPQAVQKVLREHFKIDRPLADTGWTSKVYSFEEPVGWEPEFYDSRYTMYGAMWADYILGKVQVDFAPVKARLALARQIPATILSRALAPYLDAASDEHWGLVPLQAAEKFYSREEFENKMIERITRSAGEYERFLDTMQAARNQPGSPIFQFYQRQAARDF